MSTSLTYKKCCDILEVKPADATEKTIKSQYRKLAMRYHPDKNANSPESEAKFKTLQSAYDLLEHNKFKSFEEEADQTSSSSYGFTFNKTGWADYTSKLKKQQASGLEIIRKTLDEEKAALLNSIKKLQSKDTSANSLPAEWIKVFPKLAKIIDLALNKKTQYFEAQIGSYAFLEDILNHIKRVPKETETKKPKHGSFKDSESLSIETLIYSRIATHQQLINTFIIHLTEIHLGINAIATWQKSLDAEGTQLISRQATALANCARELAANLINQFYTNFAASDREIYISVCSKGISQDLEYDKLEALKSITAQAKDLSSIMTNFKDNELPSKKSVSALKWKTSLWKKFTDALGKLIDAVKHLVFTPNYQKVEVKKAKQKNQLLRHNFVGNLNKVRKESNKPLSTSDKNSPRRKP